MVVGEAKRAANIMDGIENTGDVRLHDHRLRLKQRFDIVRKLGQGTYGKVQLGINKKTGQEVAIKTIKKCKIESEADLIRIRREVQIMSSVRHPNIVHIYEVFENSEKMILVMEYCSGGELYDFLSQKKVLQEDEARRLFRQIATAVYYCHIHKICHRDLKLENVLLDHTGSAKIADFGLSNVFKETSLLATFCGSPLYASPEIVKGTPYIGPEVDCWSLGVLLYTLVYGAMPFDGSNFKRLVRQISNGDYYEPKSPSTASPLIRDMLTVDPLKRADIAYICDHSWVNTGCETSCLEVAEVLAAETPVRLDLLLSLAPAAPSNSNSVVVPSSEHAELGAEESSAELTSAASMAVEPSNSAEKRILDLVAEGGEDAIKPSPTRTIVSASDNKRKLELAMSASGLQRKKERVASCASIAPQEPLPEEAPTDIPASETESYEPATSQPGLKSSATMTISPAPAAPAPSPAAPALAPPAPAPEPAPREPVKAPRPSREKTSPAKEKASPEKRVEPKAEETKPSAVASAADKLTALSLSQPTPANQTPAKPKKLSIPGGNVGNFKDQFERRASLTSPPEPKRPVPKPAFSVSKIAKPKAQSEDRELSSKTPDTGSVRLQQIGIEPSPTPPEEPERSLGGVKKTESEPSHGSAAVDPSVLLQDARRSLQNSMAKLVEEKAGEESRRRAARDIISTAIRTDGDVQSIGKPPVPYGRSASAGVASLASPPGTPPAPPAPSAAPRVFRTEAQHRVDDHRNSRGVSVERIIPIAVAEQPPAPPAPRPHAPPAPPATPAQHGSLRRLVSSESSASEACSSPGEPIKKSAREFIIPIAVEGKGYVTPRQRSLEPESAPRVPRTPKPRRISSLVSGGESEEEDDTHMHRLRSSRAARAESVSSGEEDEEDEGFHLLTAENLFSTLLHRVRALTTRLNGEEGPGFPHHPHSLFNNLQSPFFNSPHLPRRHMFREGWGARDLHANFESMFNKPRPLAPRGSSKKSGKHQKGHEGEAEEALDLSDLDLSAIQFSEREMRALSGLTPALSRRLQRQLLAHLPPAAARTLRRTLSLHEPSAAPERRGHTARSLSARDAADPPADPAPPSPPDPEPGPQYCTLPRLRRRSQSPPEPEARLGSLTPEPRPRERPLLSKYLTPERALSLDDSSYSSDGSLLSEPRRHSMRLAGDPPRRRVSRFLRSDFFDAPTDENVLARRKKEKELETQKILREIREKRNRSVEAPSGRSPTEVPDAPVFKDDAYARKCLSPVGLLTGKERSRSTTPFFPILDNIKETVMDTSLSSDKRKSAEDGFARPTSRVEETRDSKLVRPKSYPVKNLDTIDDPVPPATESNKENECTEKNSHRESKLMRPKSYPTSSPSPEKVNINRSVSKKEKSRSPPPKEEIAIPEVKGDVEVSFSITLPKKNKPEALAKADSLKNSESLQQNVENNKTASDSLVLKKYQIVNSENHTRAEPKVENGKVVANGGPKDVIERASLSSDSKNSKVTAKKDEAKLKSSDGDSSEKKGMIKKKIIRKVSSKTKTDLGNGQETSDGKAPEKKKVTKKVKEKTSEDGTKSTTVTKKKSMLQSLGHKLEKFASKSSSPEKVSENMITPKDKDNSKLNRMQREQSVPVSAEPPTESNLIKRAVTLTDVAALETQPSNNTKTTVSKVLGLFKKFEPKEKPPKSLVEKSQSETLEINPVVSNKPEIVTELVSDSPEKDKPRRPTSLLLNGLGRKNKYGRTASDSVSVGTAENEEQLLKKESEPKNLRNTLKLDFSRLPRVKKIVPTNPVIEPQIMNVSSEDKDIEKKYVLEKNGTIAVGVTNIETCDTLSRSRSRSRSTISNSEQKSDLSADGKSIDKKSVSPCDTTTHHPLRNHESTTPEKEDIVDRIRRKSFYTRFNEKKHRRKSSLVGPGATDYDPLSRIHSPPAEAKLEASPTSPTAYDLSPGFSIASDLSPSTERYRTLLTDLPISNRNNLRYDSYGLNDNKIDTYRSLDRNDFRKYPSSRSYLDYDQPTSYGTNRYSRTKSLLDGSDGTEESCLGQLRDPHKYNRTISMYSPGSYATYRPKRTRNSAIILKESEKEPSPENILEKIRQRKKISISVTRKPDPEKELLPRSTVSPKGEGDGAECSAKAD